MRSTKTNTKISCREYERQEKNMKKQVIFILFAIAMLSVSTLAQRTIATKIACEDTRAVTMSQMTGEAKKHKLSLNEKAMTIGSMDNVRMVFAPVAGSERLTASDLQQGANVGLLLLDSTARLRIPNGYYTVRVTRSKAGPREEGTYTATLLNGDGAAIGPVIGVPLNFVQVHCYGGMCTGSWGLLETIFGTAVLTE